MNKQVDKTKPVKNHTYETLVTIAFATLVIIFAIRLGAPLEWWTIFIPLFSPLIAIAAGVILAIASFAVLFICALFLMMVILGLGIICIIPVAIIVGLVLVAKKLDD